MQFLASLYKKVETYPTIRRGWHLLFLFILIYLISNVYIFFKGDINLEQFYLQITSLLLTVYLLALIMLTANKKVQEENEKQTNIFIKSLNEVSSKLDVSISKLEQVVQNLAQGNKQHQAEIQENIRRLKPNLKFNIMNTKFLFLIDRYEGLVINKGAKALGVSISVIWYGKTLELKNFNRHLGDIDINQKSIQFYLDDINRVNKNRKMKITLSFTDSEYRLYTELSEINFKH